ncbi:hypothetical protein J2129_001912 [Methanofollis sp. W23]|nr:hypothetical protein [Methanofollis sp. W23]
MGARVIFPPSLMNLAGGNAPGVKVWEGMNAWGHTEKRKNTS